MARNTIKCNLTNKERITNNVYLTKCLKRTGLTEEEFRNIYASEVAVAQLRAEILEHGLSECARRYNRELTEIYNIALYNGKNKLFKEAYTQKFFDTIIPST